MRYVKELICDYIGAGKTYSKNWSQQTPYMYYNTQKDKMILHPDTRKFIERVFFSIFEYGWEDTCKELRNFKTY